MIALLIAAALMVSLGVSQSRQGFAADDDADDDAAEVTKLSDPGSVSRASRCCRATSPADAGRFVDLPLGTCVRLLHTRQLRRCTW